MKSVEWLAERFNYLNSMVSKKEMDSRTAKEWQVDFIYEAKSMLNKELRQAWEDGYKKAHQDIVTNSFSTFEQYQNEKNG
jgi:hypothetical protein